MSKAALYTAFGWLQSDSQRIIPQISNAENSDGIY